MRIGYDAKRLFTNFTGLGNYSRSFVHHYHASFPEDELVLFTPSIKQEPRTQPFLDDKSYHIIQPEKNNPFWRSFDMVKDIEKTGIDIYHGLSHELPVGISRIHVACVVTIHDLIFKYYKEDHPWLDRIIYDWKWKHACGMADKIVAISEQTKADLIEYYNIPEEKIIVIYQPADPSFLKKINTESLSQVRLKYGLPSMYNLYVGSVITRKNLILIVKAMSLMHDADRIPLVIIGSGKKYKEMVQHLAVKEKIDHLLVWMEGPVFADFPAIYKNARMMIYPSLHEGFGLPVMEAMHVGVPVITSNQSSLKEAGGNAAILIDPLDPVQLKEAMLKLQSDDTLRNDLVQKGVIHASGFNANSSVEQYHQLYQSLL